MMRKIRVKRWTFIFLIIALAIVCCIYCIYVQSYYVPSKSIDPLGFATLDELGIFGNYFNGISAPLFAFIGIVLTLFAIYAQSDNQLQQTKIQQESTFANIFNNLVSEYRVSQNFISINKGKKVYVGKRVFEVLNSELNHFYVKEYIDNNGLNDASLDKNDLVKRAMDLVHVDRRLCYEQHLKLLYNILKYIDQKCAEKDKDLYAGMLRSFIPVEEERFIYYEALQEEFKKFKLLLEKYSMMHDIKEDLIAPEHASMYDQKAFD